MNKIISTTLTLQTLNTPIIDGIEYQQFSDNALALYKTAEDISRRVDDHYAPEYPPEGPYRALKDFLTDLLHVMNLFRLPLSEPAALCERPDGSLCIDLPKNTTIVVEDLT
jgi:hypothetical protein